MKMKPYQKISLLYLLISIVWVFLSGKVIHFFVSDKDLLGLLQAINGLVYVFFTSGLLYYLIHKSYEKMLDKEKEKNRIYTTTVRAVFHILNNFLNEMHLIKLEAENSKDFDPEVLKLHEEVIHETSAHLKKLEEITEVTVEKITETAYGIKVDVSAFRSK